MKLNTHSGMVSSDSGKKPKSVHDKPEWVFTFVQNRCSRSTRMGVHVGPEYALDGASDLWSDGLSAFTLTQNFEQS